jgi:hypothetical protein
MQQCEGEYEDFVCGHRRYTGEAELQNEKVGEDEK